jgi:hypothetical protein
MNFHKRWLLPVAMVCTLLSNMPACAQGLPTGDAVLEKYIEATGGKAGREKFKNRVSKGSMELPGVGIKGKMTSYAAAPNKMLVEIDLTGIGKIQEGFDGNVGWSDNPTMGPRIKEGAEKQAAQRRADFYSALNWRKHFKKAKCVGVETVEGKACYKVELTTNDDQVKTQYFDKATNLLIKSSGKEKTPMGDIEVESVVSDYRKVDGLTIPFKTIQKAASQEIVITLDKVEHDVNLPPNRFELPPDIKKLAGQ